MVEWNKSQKIAAGVLGEIVFWGLVLGLSYWLGFPGGGLFVAALFALNVIVVLGGYFVSRENVRFAGYQTKTEEQLSGKEAFELAEYLLAYGDRYGYRIDRTVDRGIDPAVAPSDDKEDSVRLFKLEFEPLNLQGRATLYIDLEQELSVDLDDTRTLQNAMSKIQNSRIQKSWLSVDYEERVADTKESLGRSVDPTITKIVETDEGREIRERPVITQNPDTDESDSKETES
ncbi:hypothetical protein [Halorarum halobium]|uniref:hypothetical protein n=1 Tax=Halorarum halobium TaxID=3075121 RepID=UPI0028AB37B6|nr:hypothetical protein [Halobaculum sp. XH14]